MEFEKDIESYLRRRIESDVGGLCIKGVGVKGIPDRMVIVPPDGMVVWCEIKRSDGRLSEMQKYQHARLKKLGARVEVLWSREDVDRLVSTLTAEYKEPH